MHTLNEQLKLLRTAQNLTQKHVADHLGIKEVSYQRYEYGDRTPNLNQLIALANFYNISLDYLVGRSDNPENK